MRALVTAVLLTATLLTACSDDDPETGDGSGETVTATPQPTEGRSPRAQPTRPQGSNTPKPDKTPPKVVDEIATGLAAPWGIAFLPNGDAVVTERDTTRV